ncbi:protein phosphatase 1 regulatory subunit 3B-like [Uloborus diversus]|uniref:protein phosphatase 1 regulatory subunit 3B-like n=1 Tax=Uloborus diversus TaxID=327109 RepID=UPI00240A1036|nr:protein phosphatase 1 regulatory subunit 3B-like [Uloborus diversus]
MPVDLEMFLSAAASPFFEYTPFGEGRFAVTNAYNDSRFRRSLSLPRNHFLVESHHKQPPCKRQPYHKDLTSKEKNSAASADVLSFGARKKKVSFADDRGFSLVEVREIPGSTKWADQVLTLLIGDAKKSVVLEKKWKLSFQHPPWEDEALIRFLQTNAVVLESVSVTDDNLYGSIKVRNLAYEKNVFVRVTFDRWVSYVDITASYVKHRLQRQSVYDTFSFTTRVSPAAFRYQVIELCVCFKCNGKEYWDNNGGINYRLVMEPACGEAGFCERSKYSKPSNKMTVSLSENLEKFSEIDSWSSLMYGQPYW